MKFITPVLNIFRYHKLKIAALFGFYIFFMYWMFPFNDLGDLVAAKVSQLSQGAVFVDFDGLSLSVFPQPGISLSNVSVETPFTPALTAKSLEVAPSIAGLLSFKPGVTVRAYDILGGNIVLSTRGGDKTPAGKQRQKVSVDLTQVSLTQLSKLADLPLKVEGNLNGDVDSMIDPDFGEQPQGNLDVKIDRAVIPEGSITTDLGPFPIPRVNLNDAAFEGHMEKGSLDISKLVLGRPGGDLYATVVGKMDFKMQKGLGGVVPISGGYDFSIHLTVGEPIKQKLGAVLSFLTPYQTSGNSYAFRAMGAGPNAPPNLQKIQ